MLNNRENPDNKRTAALYERYVSEGPGRLKLSETTAALRFRDEEPTAALRIRIAAETRKREGEEEAALREAWLLQGNDERDFRREYPKLKAERDAARLRELDEGARGAAARRMARSF